jgi:DNA-directed RNA polymerase subunit N (RpoN/RPB10)
MLLTVRCFRCKRFMPTDFSGDVPVTVEGVERYVCSDRCAVKVTVTAIKKVGK